MKKLFLVFMLLFVCVNEPILFAKTETKTQKTALVKKGKHKAKKGKNNRCKKTDGLAQQLSLLRLELDSLDKNSSKENIEKLNGWIDHLETKVVSTLKHAEASLEKHKTRLSEAAATGDETTEKTAEKIRSNESKIESCHELLKIIDQLKTQIKQKTENLSQ